MDEFRFRTLADDKKDGERYRWLRNANWIDDAIMANEGIIDGQPETLDAAIDRELGSQVTVNERHE